MANEFRQTQQSGEARRALDQRLARKEMGDEAYQRMIAPPDRGARLGLLAFFAVFALVVLAVTVLGK